MSLDVVEVEASEAPDIVRACLKMTAAGVAVAVLPYALHVGAIFVLSALNGEGFALASDDVTGMAQVVLLCALAAGLHVLGRGVLTAIRARVALRIHGFVGAWLAIAGAALVLWCWPPFWYFTTVWMFVGATLATRPLWWAAASSGPLDADDVRTHRRFAMALTVGITVLSHVAAWTTVLASSFLVPAEEFARVDAIRRGEAVERREWELRDGEEREPDFYDRAMLGATAAGRSVGGDMSAEQLFLGHWPQLVQARIAPAPEGPSYRESWYIAAIAFAMSLAFWLPWMLTWTWLTSRGRAQAPPAGMPGRGDA